MVTKVEGRLHSFTLRDVKMEEAGDVKLTAKDFVTQAKLTVNGMNTEQIHPCCFLIVYICILSVSCWLLLRGAYSIQGFINTP